MSILYHTHIFFFSFANKTNSNVMKIFLAVAYATVALAQSLTTGCEIYNTPNVCVSLNSVQHNQPANSFLESF